MVCMAEDAQPQHGWKQPYEHILSHSHLDQFVQKKDASKTKLAYLPVTKTKRTLKVKYITEGEGGIICHEA